jgi:hypothetical protein
MNMGVYAKSQASPFWQGMLSSAAVLFAITLVIPLVYYAKYALFDQPCEMRAARTAPQSPVALLSNINMLHVQAFIQEGERGASSAQRSACVQALGELILSPYAQITHPFECLSAKVALGHIIQHDPDAAVRSLAFVTLIRVAAHGAVLKR